MALDPSTPIVQSDGVIANEVDGEAVMLSIESGKYFGLDPVGTAVWNLLAEPRSLDQLCAELVDRFDVDDDTCRREVTAFVQVLLADGSLRVAP